jgi:hypothetical protein
VRLVIPSLQRFMQKTREKEFSKSTPAACIMVKLTDVVLLSDTDPSKCKYFLIALQVRND